METQAPAPRPLFEHVPHPHVAARQQHGPPKVADQHLGFNGRLAAGITEAVGTMPAVYIVLVVQVAWMVLASGGIWLWRADPYPFAFLLFLSNCVQLPLMFVIMVGQSVLGGAADKRAMQTYQDAEAILHEANQLEQHLAAQDAHLLQQDDKLEAAIKDVQGMVNALEALVQRRGAPAPGRGNSTPAAESPA